MVVFNSNIASKSTSDLLFGAAVLLLQDLGRLSLGFEPLHHLHHVPHLRSKLRPNMERSHPCYISKYLFSHPCYVSKCLYTNPRGSPHLGERLLDLVHVKPLTDHLALESTLPALFHFSWSLSEPLRWLFQQRRFDWLWRSFHIQTPCCGEETSPPDPTENRVILGDKSFLNNFQSRSFLTRNKRTKFSIYHDFLIFLLFSLTYRHQHTFSLVKQNPCLVQLNGKMAVENLFSGQISFHLIFEKKSTFFSLFLLSSFISLSSLLNMSLISSLSSGKMDKWTIGNEASDKWTIGQVTSNKILTNCKLQCESAKVSIQNSIVTNKRPKNWFNLNPAASL